MKYTSLSHWNTGHNVQQNWNSVEEWQDYCTEDSSVVWSKLFKSVDGELIGEYPERLLQTSSVAATVGKLTVYREFREYQNSLKEDHKGYLTHIVTGINPNEIGVGEFDLYLDQPPSPRITEHDALQIIKSWSGYFDQETFEMWVMAKGRALIDKLNEV